MTDNTEKLLTSLQHLFHKYNARMWTYKTTCSGHGYYDPDNYKFFFYVDTGAIEIPYGWPVGNCKCTAAVIGVYEITPEQPYTAADLDWRDKTSRSTLEMKDKNSRPAIKGKCENIADYDTVWIGFPIWWYTAPTIVNTFIEAHDLSGKVLNVFATSGGSDVKDSYNDLKKAYPQYKWGESLLMN